MNLEKMKREKAKRDRVILADNEQRKVLNEEKELKLLAHLKQKYEGK
jgi:hypothetical protein